MVLACVLALGAVELVGAVPVQAATPQAAAPDAVAKDPGRLPVQGGPAKIDPEVPAGDYSNLPPRLENGRPPKPEPKVAHPVPIEQRNAAGGSPGFDTATSRARGREDDG